MARTFRWALVASVAVASIAPMLGCGGNNAEPYKPVPAWSGRKASVPAPPTLPSLPIKSGDAYTVYGAIHHLRSRMHEKDVNGKEVTLVAYIVDSNIPRAPKCAIHKTGKADPESCQTEMPAFWVADQKGDTKGPKIRVLGWATNFANIFDAMEKYGKAKEPPKELVKDELLAVDIPFPLPAVGAKVKLTGKYGFTYHGSNLASDPVNGVMTYGKIEVLEPAPEPAKFDNK